MGLEIFSQQYFRWLAFFLSNAKHRKRIMNHIGHRFIFHLKKNGPTIPMGWCIIKEYTTSSFNIIRIAPCGGQCIGVMRPATTWFIGDQKPIALYPDSLGYIFSGSAVVDYNNTSGLGKKGQVPLVAIFTHHDPKGEKEGRNDFQNESIAYSLDNGNTWIKYAGNPVLKNPGIKDFRDPKVMWYEPQKKWIMTLATKDRITFFSSPDLKHWKKLSEFGEDFRRTWRSMGMPGSFYFG